MTPVLKLLKAYLMVKEIQLAHIVGSMENMMEKISMTASTVKVWNTH